MKAERLFMLWRVGQPQSRVFGTVRIQQRVVTVAADQASEAKVAACHKEGR
jgi:hypothetical protein